MENHDSKFWTGAARKPVRVAALAFGLALTVAAVCTAWQCVKSPAVRWGSETLLFAAGALGSLGIARSGR